MFCICCAFVFFENVLVVAINSDISLRKGPSSGAASRWGLTTKETLHVLLLSRSQPFLVLRFKFLATSNIGKANLFHHLLLNVVQDKKGLGEGQNAMMHGSPLLCPQVHASDLRF